MAQSGLIATVAATASEIVDHKAALSLVESAIAAVDREQIFKVRRQSRRSAYVALRCLHGSDPYAAIETSLTAAGFAVVRLGAAESEARRSKDGDLKRQREGQLEALQKAPLDLVQNLLLLRGQGGSEKQRRIDALLGNMLFRLEAVR